MGQNKALLQAHRGVSTEYPENTLSAFRAAAEQGYPYIELDPGVTRDGVAVVLHDSTVNRTGRFADGTKLPKPTPVRDLTIAQARELDFGLWKSDAFRGEPIPLLADVLTLAAESGMTVKIDSKFLYLPDPEREAVVSVLKASDAKLALTINPADLIPGYVSRFPHAEIHYDGPVDEETLEYLQSVVPTEQLVVWAAFPNAGTSWVKIRRADDELCAMIRRCSRLGLWILSTDEERRIAEDRWQADIIETTGSLKP